MLWPSGAGHRCGTTSRMVLASDQLDRPGSAGAESPNHTGVIFPNPAPGFPRDFHRTSGPFPGGRIDRRARVATKEKDVGARRKLVFKRHFTKEGVHPFDEVEWEVRD